LSSPSPEPDTHWKPEGLQQHKVSRLLVWGQLCTVYIF
jgi:hypothetical protein